MRIYNAVALVCLLANHINSQAIDCEYNDNRPLRCVMDNGQQQNDIMPPKNQTTSQRRVLNLNI